MAKQKYAVELQGYRYVSRELKKRFGDDEGKEIFGHFKNEIASIFNRAVVVKSQKYVPVATGQLRGSMKVKVTAKSVYIQIGTARTEAKAVAQHMGWTDRGGGKERGKFWIWNTWRENKAQVHREMVPVAQRYASMVGRKLNSRQSF